jgi:hypothetical protein
LARAPGVIHVHEPDNEKRDPFALKAKRRLGRFPVVDRGEELRTYASLWEGAFAGGIVSDSAAERTCRRLMERVSPEELESAAASQRRSLRVRAISALARPRGAAPEAEVVIVKSVHAPLSLDWVRARGEPLVVAVMRHPLNVIASMLELDMPDRDRHLDRNRRVLERLVRPWNVPLPDESASEVHRVAWQVGVLSTALERSVGPDDVTVVHEDVCVEPGARFRSLFERCGLMWTADVEDHLRASDRPGSGFKPVRVAAELPERWRKRLGDTEVEEIREVLRSFPTTRWPNDESLP